MTQYTEHPGKIVQTKKGIFRLGNLRFFDYTQTEPEPGAINIGYIRDLPSVQLDFIGKPRNEVLAALDLHRHKISRLQGFVTMTHTLARHIIQLYGLPPDFPYEIFMNYPDYRPAPTPDEKRDEFVYIGAIPVKFTETLKFLTQLQDRTGFESFFVKRKNYKNNPLTNDCLHVDNYDFGSRYGLLINVNDFPQAAECLPRKILLYLMAGIYPVFHESFTESIAYCHDNGVPPIVYRTVDDLVEFINNNSSINNNIIKRQHYSMEFREAELISKLDRLRQRGLAPLSARTHPTLNRRSTRRRPVNRERRALRRRTTV